MARASWYRSNRSSRIEWNVPKNPFLPSSYAVQLGYLRAMRKSKPFLPMQVCIALPSLSCPRMRKKSSFHRPIRGKQRRRFTIGRKSLASGNIRGISIVQSVLRVDRVGKKKRRRGPLDRRVCRGEGRLSPFYDRLSVDRGGWVPEKRI